MIYGYEKDPRSLLGSAVSGNNIRQVGVLIDYAQKYPAPAYPSYQVHWASGRLEWVQVSELKSIDHEIAGHEARIAQLQAAKARALRAGGQ